MRRQPIIDKYAPFKGEMRNLDTEFRTNLFADKHVPYILFHSTNQGGFEGILRSRQLYATHFRHLNDDKEIIYGDDLLCAFLEARLNNETNELIKNTYNECLNKPKFRSVIKSFDEEIYLTSFAENGDQSHYWKNYADEGKGYAIGINPRQLNYKIDGPIIIPLQDDELAFVKVIYDPDRQNAIIAQIVDKAREIIIKNSLIFTDNTFYKQAALQLSLILSQLTLFFKRPDFDPIHDEWRVIQRRWGKNAMDSIDNSIAERGVLYRSSNGKQVPYLPLNFSLNGADHIMPIETIILGPNLQSEDNLMETQKFLSDLDYTNHKSMVKNSKSEPC